MIQSKSDDWINRWHASSFRPLTNRWPTQQTKQFNDDWLALRNTRREKTDCRTNFFWTARRCWGEFSNLFVSADVRRVGGVRCIRTNSYSENIVPARCGSFSIEIEQGKSFFSAAQWERQNGIKVSTVWYLYTLFRHRLRRTVETEYEFLMKIETTTRAKQDVESPASDSGVVVLSCWVSCNYSVGCVGRIECDNGQMGPQHIV